MELITEMEKYNKVERRVVKMQMGQNCKEWVKIEIWIFGIFFFFFLCEGQDDSCDDLK